VTAAERGSEHPPGLVGHRRDDSSARVPAVSFLFPSSTLTFEAAFRDLASGSPKARTAAAQALGDLTDSAETRRAVEALTRALDDDHPDVRMEACVSLGALRDPAALPGLIKRLDDGAPAVRQNAAIALGSIGHPQGFEPLEAALRDGPADLRFQAATSLVEIDPARAFAPVAEALHDRDPQVVAAAALALGAIGDVRACEPIAACLEHASANTRFDVAYALADLGDPRGRATLIGGLAEPERAWDAVTALARLGAPEDADALGRALTSKRTPAEATVLAAGKLLALPTGAAHHEAARRVLLAALGARKTHVRGLAVEQLDESGGAWAIAPLEKLARSSKGRELTEVIDAALRTISERAPSSQETER